MSAALDRITASITNANSTVDAAITLIANLADEIRARVDDSVALNALADELDAEQKKLADAIVTNTPEQPSAPANQPPADSLTPITGSVNTTQADSGSAFPVNATTADGETPVTATSNGAPTEILPTDTGSVVESNDTQSAQSAPGTITDAGTSIGGTAFSSPDNKSEAGGVTPDEANANTSAYTGAGKVMHDDTESEVDPDVAYPGVGEHTDETDPNADVNDKLKDSSGNVIADKATS